MTTGSSFHSRSWRLQSSTIARTSPAERNSPKQRRRCAFVARMGMRAVRCTVVTMATMVRMTTDKNEHLFAICQDC